MAKIPILSVYDKDGNRIEVPAIVGRSAYQSARKFGYAGTEEEWVESLRGGRSIASIRRTDGNGAAGTTDTYTIIYNDNKTDTFTVYNGADGKNGKSPTIAITENAPTLGGNDPGSYVITVFNPDGTTSVATIKNGVDGKSISITNIEEIAGTGSFRGHTKITFSDGHQIIINGGKPGENYILTDADKAEIAQQAAEQIDTDKFATTQQVNDLSDEVEGKADKTGWGANKYLGTDVNGNIIEKEPPTTGTGGITEETDPTVPSWAKQPQKPKYTAEEVGADASGTANGKVSEHNVARDTHNDIRLLISDLSNRLNTVANSTDEDLDQIAEIVEYIKANKGLIEGVTTNKVNVSDIIDNLTTNVSNKPLSAKMGVQLKALIDAIKVPTKTSELTNDSGFLTEHQSLDEYAKKSDIPTVPVRSVNGRTGDVQLGAGDVGALPVNTKIPAKTSDLTNDSGYITGIPSEYVTETELNSKGYLTQHQDLSNYAKKDEVPKSTAELTNNSGFIDRTVSDLVNYYKKSETLSASEINNKISAIPKFAISVVSSLPTSDISDTTVYLVGGGTGSDLYTEYIFIIEANSPTNGDGKYDETSGTWEVLGSQRVDLTGYATQSWVNVALADYIKTSELTSVINTALAEAKASGEFTGDSGVHVGTADDMPAGTKVLVNPNGRTTKIPAIDKTLSKEGYAADAKVVGDEISDLSEAIAEYHAPFANKKIVAIGDSIVQGDGDGAGGFLAALKTKYPDITTVNMGVGSTTFAFNNSVPANKSEGCIFSRIDNIPADADYIILQGGLNDFFHRDTYKVQFGEYVANLHKYPINAYYDGSYHQLYYGAEYGGTTSQVFYQETFCGAFEMSLVKIMTRFYNKKYALLIPHDPTGSAELAKYLDAEARICKKYGFPCIDLRLSAGMPRIKAIAGGSDGTSAYTVDEVHPNMVGYTTQYLPAIERWLTDGSVENAGAVTLAEVMQNAGGGSPAVESVNGKTGAVMLSASDVGAISASEKVQITITGADGKERTYELYGTLMGIGDGGGTGGDTPSEPADPNKVPTSVDVDGSIYNGTGYKDDTRFSTTTGATKDLANGTVTGFIEIDGTQANTIRIAGYPWITSIDYNMICAYNADKTFIGAVTAKNGGTSTTGTVIFDSLTGDNNVAEVVIKAGLNIKYIRVGYYDSANADVTGANLIVTVNEEIT